MSWWSFKPYVSVEQRREKALKEIRKLETDGYKAQPVTIEKKTIARTFWGKAWCDNLNRYSDYDNRLPRGRSYVRNGQVCDLRIEPGCVKAKVCGSDLYDITITIDALPVDRWDDIKKQCAGGIGSLIELLKGQFSSSVMQIITQEEGGLFPQLPEIKVNCSCFDWATMCKHVAAAMYGVGARLDAQPELLFTLRQVDHLELISQAGNIQNLTKGGSAHKTIAADALGDVFGIELETPAAAAPEEGQPVKPATKASRPAKRVKRAIATKDVAGSVRGSKVSKKAVGGSPAKARLKSVKKSAVKKATVKKASVKKDDSATSKTRRVKSAGKLKKNARPGK